MTDLPTRLRDLARRRPEALALLGVVPAILLLPKAIPAGVLGLGVVAAAPLAMQAAGIVLVYRSNHFINVAQVQVGAVAGTLFALLINARPVFRALHSACPPCVGSSGTPAERQLAYWAFLLFSVYLAVLLSWRVYLAVVRTLDRAPRLVLTVASIFLVTVLTGAQNLLYHLLTTTRQRTFGVLSPVPPPVHWVLEVAPARFSAPDLLAVGAAAVLLPGIGVLLARSRTGTAIRAASESPGRAQTLGIDVVTVTGRVWLLAGALSGAAGVLAAMDAPAGDGSTPAGAGGLVRVLLVAVVARFSSLPMAGLAALAFGVLTAAVEFAVGSTTVLDGLLVVLLSGLLLLQRRESLRADRDTSSAYLSGRQARPVPASLRRLPTVVRTRWSALGLLAVTVLAAPFLLSPSQTSALGTTVVYAIVGLSLLVLTGWAGQVSLGQFSLSAVGAYAVAVSGLPFLLAVPLAMLAAAAVATLLGLPALRLRGLTLAVSTLAFAVSTTAILLNPDELGSYLPATVHRPVLLGVSLDDQRAFYFVALIFLVLTVAAVTGLRRSRTARALLAARDNEPAAQSFGIGLLRARLTAFALSGALAGLAGALFAYQQAGVVPEAFSVDRSLVLFSATVIGGLGSVTGPLAGFAVLAGLALAPPSPGAYQAVTGVGGLLLLLLVPGGLAQLGLSLRDGLLRRVARRHGLPAPGLMGRARADDRPGLLPSTRFVPSRYALPGHWAMTPAARAAVEAGHD